MLPLSQRERGTGIGRRVIFNLYCFTTNAVDWVVRRSSHRAVLSSATTSLSLLVPAPRHGSPPAVPRFAPSGTAPCTVPRPKDPVYQLRGCWPFVYVMPQDVAVYRHAGRCSLPSCWTLQFTIMLDITVYCHAGRSSLTSWGTFWAARTMPDWDVLVAAALACLAHESCELVCDVAHHGQTSAGRAHCYSVSS
jgi:hypothetical protein